MCIFSATVETCSKSCHNFWCCAFWLFLGEAKKNLILLFLLLPFCIPLQVAWCTCAFLAFRVSVHSSNADYFSYHLLNACQEATVRTGHGTTDWFQIGKGVHQGCILSPCLFNLYAEDIMRNAGLEEAQAGIKTAGRNINNLRYADDTTLMAEGEEELKSLLMKVRVKKLA